jgi:hypothetical protein
MSGTLNQSPHVIEIRRIRPEALKPLSRFAAAVSKERPFMHLPRRVLPAEDGFRTGDKIPPDLRYNVVGRNQGGLVRFVSSEH